MPLVPHTAFPFAYIGPGAGFAFLGSFLSLVLAVLAGLASLLLWPFRMLYLVVRRRRRGSARARVKKLVFLGLDGLDPALTERFLAEGKLPHLARLRDTGSYSRLRTTFPALSPVAWSTFATGVNPGRHNIFDFLDRGLRTYAPELSSCRVHPPRRVLRWGRFRIPLSRPSVEMRRKSEPFWKILARHAVGCTILRVPITFPPDDFNGRLLSAMSTPDLRGTQGTFSLFTSAAGDAGENRYPLTPRQDGFEGAITGPDNAFVEGEAALRVPFFVRRTTGHGIPELEIQGHRYKLPRGEYTPWIRIGFHAAPAVAVRGIARFLLTQTEPHVEIYATPVQIDPESPALPISQPGYYAAYLAKLLGTFSTLGMAEDTWALNEGAIGEDAFLAQAASIQSEREGMFFSALDHTRRGVVACVFDTSDRVQHMFFRHLHTASRHSGVIENLYRDMDRVVGRTLEYVDADTALFVLSDHGFCAFRRGVNLNTWLLQEGYLHLESGAIDWNATQAYTLGLGGLYLNLRGREARGIVAPDDADRLKRELIERLSGLRDGDTGEIAIQRVYAASTIYNGPYLRAAPDLIVGYAEGYRTSWDAAVGKVSPHVFETNEKAWSGDHCVDPVLVPGVLFSNLKMDAADPGIEDMAPTALRLFGITPPKWMEGESVIRT